MRIAMINGSPKAGPSNSAFLLQTLESLLAEGHEIAHYRIRHRPLTEEQQAEICETDALVLASPLYVDGLPSHLFREMVSLEAFRQGRPSKPLHVYVLMNNGFYEGTQNKIALEIVENWCERCGFTFGQGLGHGAGEMLGSLDKVPLGKGPMANLGRAMSEMAARIQHLESGPPLLFSPNFPRFAWKWSATHSFWNGKARRNGLKTKDVLRRL